MVREQLDVIISICYFVEIKSFFKWKLFIKCYSGIYFILLFCCEVINFILDIYYIMKLNLDYNMFNRVFLQ